MKKLTKPKNKPPMYAMKQEKPGIIIKNATFITSAAKAEQFIQPDKPMIAVCGKSNVGKSSFINMRVCGLLKVAPLQGFEPWSPQ